MVDDSIVRGIDSRFRVVNLRWRPGAKEVHMRISRPLAQTRLLLRHRLSRSVEELLANQCTLEEICKYLGADPLVISILTEWFGRLELKQLNFGTACFSGEYPVPYDAEFTISTVMEKRVKPQCLLEQSEPRLL